MKIYYGSAAYFMYIAAALFICAALYIILRGKSQKIQEYVILGIMLINVLQHLFKSLIYPQHTGLGFSALSTAYNICATLILISPLALLLNLKILKDFVFYVGSVAGIIATVIPYWNIGKDALHPEVMRSFICHTLLFVSSLLPLLLGLHKPSYRCFYKIGFCFLAVLCIIILNDAVCILIGIYPGVEGMTLAEALYVANPVWVFGPPEDFSWVMSIAKVFSPDAWVGVNDGGRLIPVLWYAVPLYLGITVVSLPVCALVDRKNFVSNFKKYTQKIKLRKNKI